MRGVCYMEKITIFFLEAYDADKYVKMYILHLYRNFHIHTYANSYVRIMYQLEACRYVDAMVASNGNTKFNFKENDMCNDILV